MDNQLEQRDLFTKIHVIHENNLRLLFVSVGERVGMEIIKVIHSISLMARVYNNIMLAELQVRYPYSSFCF